MNCWLMKSEPDAFSIDDLKAVGTEPWDGVRNYQARNFMRDDMSPGDPVLFYHSNCKEPGVVGIAEVASRPYPDPTQFDPESKYFDPGSDPDDPRWILIDVAYRRHLKRVIGLREIKQHADALEGLPLIRRGNRLSVMPVARHHWDYMLELEKP
ncbi:MAG: EVE domain-containing protein [Pseudomonadota bacterium]|nr:MAG: EVE domain-containing protein [Pseudomonadota bacterium]